MDGGAASSSAKLDMADYVNSGGGPGMGSYKEAKEAFVSQLEGGSIGKINAVSLTALTTYLLWAALRSRGLAFLDGAGRDLELLRLRRDYKHKRRRQEEGSEHNGIQAGLWTTWLIEFGILIVPIILACTVLSERLVLLNSGLLAASTYVLMTSPSLSTLQVRSAAGTTGAPSNGDGKKRHWADKDSSDEEEEREEVEEEQQKAERASLEKAIAKQHARHSSTHYLHLDDEPPLRVSVDSAAESAHAAAAPPTEFVPPGSEAASSVDSVASKHLADVVRNENAVLNSQASGSSSAGTSSLPKNRPFLTVYRAHMMLMTIICILAVDFPAFPREFAKCETWGTSLMDLGVGSFVFSLGLVSAYPMLRSPRHRFRPLRSQLLSDMRRSLPLFALGSIRVIMVKGVDYPEHVAEYGVHWNFFITLALLPFLGTLCRPLTRRMRFAAMGLLVMCAHQAMLSGTTTGEWASSNTVPRTDLFSQNKEGIVSFPGYAAIYLLGLDLGHYILPRDPYLAYRRVTRTRQEDKLDSLAMLLLSLSLLWWGGYYLQRLALPALVVSRRLANLPYIVWVTAYNTSFLLAYVGIYLVLLQPLGQTQSPSESAIDEAYEQSKTPALLRALNAHAFAVFLLANLATGLVNMSMQTMYAGDGVAMVVLCLYVAASLAVATFLQLRGWRLKL